MSFRLLKKLVAQNIRQVLSLRANLQRGRMRLTPPPIHPKEFGQNHLQSTQNHSKENQTNERQEILI